MGRVPQILIGSILLLLGALLGLISFIPGEESFRPMRLTSALLASILGFACVFHWGRPYTTRIALGLLSLVMAVSAYYFWNPREMGPSWFAGLVALISGGYALFGYYPKQMPLSDVFGDAHAKKPDAKPPRDTIARWQSDLRSFDLGRLTFVGWVVFVLSIAAGVTVLIIVDPHLEALIRPWLGKRTADWATGFTSVAGILGFFFAAKWLLHLAGVTMIRPKADPSQESDEWGHG